MLSDDGFISPIPSTLSRRRRPPPCILICSLNEISHQCTSPHINKAEECEPRQKLEFTTPLGISAHYNYFGIKIVL